MALLPVGLLAAGTIMGAVGQYQQGQAQAAASRTNAANATEGASLTLQQGAFEAARTRYQGQRLTSAQEAAYAASGVKLTGSPIEVMKESNSQNELDAMTQTYNSKIAAKTQLSAAQQYTQQANNYARASLFNAGTTLLTGIGTLSTRYGGKQIPTSTTDLGDSTPDFSPLQLPAGA